MLGNEYGKPLPFLQRISDSVLCSWPDNPKMPLPVGDLDPHQYMVPWALASQPQKDRPRLSVCSNRPHLAVAAIRPKNS